MKIVRNILIPFSVCVLCSCNNDRPPQLTQKCRHVVLSQYAACVEKYGEANVEIWTLRNNSPGWTEDNKIFNYHAQVRVRYKGKWWWLPNHHASNSFTEYPQGRARLFKRTK